MSCGVFMISEYHGNVYVLGYSCLSQCIIVRRPIVTNASSSVAACYWRLHCLTALFSQAVEHLKIGDRCGLKRSEKLVLVTIQMHLIPYCITTESSASIACWYQSQHYMIRSLQPHTFCDTVSILVVYKDTSCIIQQSLKDLMIAVDWLCPWLESLAIMLLPGPYLDVWFNHIG